MEEVKACLKKILPQSSSSQSMSITRHDAAGTAEPCEARVYTLRVASGLRRSKTCFEKPPDLRETRTLTHETEEGNPRNWIFLPPGPMRPVIGDGLGTPICGSDFNTEDLDMQQGFERSGTTERLPDEAMDGRPVYVTRHRPDGDSGSRYTRLDSWIDKQTCVTLKTDYYAAGEMLEKTLTADSESLEEVSGIWIASRARMQSAVDPTYSDLRTSDVEIDVKLSKRLFEPKQLHRRCR